MEYIEQQLSDCGCTIRRNLVGDGTYNLIVEKGAGSTVLGLVGHVDTVKDRDSPPCKLRIDASRLHGLGVWDMKAGVMAMIDVLRRIDVPAGMKVVAVFVVDEEKQSKGALALVHQEQRQKMKMIFSPEIPTNALPMETGQKPIVIARRGRTKLNGNLVVPASHGALWNTADLEDYYASLKRFIRTKVERMLSPQKSSLGLIDSLHIRQPASALPIREGVEGEFYSVPTHLNFSWGHSSAPPHIVSELVTWYRDRVDQWNKWTFRKEGRLHSDGAVPQNGRRYGAKVTLADDLTSYDPYFLDVEHQYSMEADQIGHLVDKVYASIAQTHVFVGGASTSDANVFVQHGWAPYFEMSAPGEGAHTRHEQTSNEGVALLIKFMERLMRGEAFNS